MSEPLDSGASAPPAAAQPAAPTPLVVALAMGYGHLRAAHALAEELGTEVLHADRPPLAEGAETRLWETARRLYEWTSRASQVPVVGRPLRWLLDAITAIPDLHPRHDLSTATRPVRLLGRLIDRGMGLGLARRLAAEGRPLLTTYFAPALAVDDHRRGGRAGAADPGSDEPRLEDGSAPAPLYCVVTDVDLARAWVGREPATTGVCYLVPSGRAVRRLAAYGVPQERVERTGFPLPGELLGGPELPVLKRRLAERLMRLDPRGVFRDALGPEIAQFLGPLPEAPMWPGRPPSRSAPHEALAAAGGRHEGAPDTASHCAEGRIRLASPATTFRRPGTGREAVQVTYVVGGAGAQTGFAEPLLRSLAPGLRQGRFRLALVAGVRPEVAEVFRRQAREAGLGDDGSGEDGRQLERNGVEIVLEEDVEAYFRRFNRLLATTDVLWTKPSELTFFGALGLPLVFTRPVGVQERHNRRWAEDRGAGLRGPVPHHAAERLEAWLADGTLATAAWNGFLRLPKHGLYRILERVGGERG